ncbi:MAG: glycosyltransferase [Burkholderiales bacterium]|nr:MAG: glycosyltransferase [Burkholderiales bacterium]
MISIITATYNVRDTIVPLTASLKAQTSADFEWIVVDGASTDGTQLLLAQMQGLPLRWISEPDFGIYHALNKGLGMASGDYYLVVGADDQLEPHAIESFSAALKSAPDVVSAPVWIEDVLMRPRDAKDWFRSGPPMVAAHSVGTLMRRDLHQRLGWYSRRYPIAADTFFLLRAVEAGCRFIEIDKPVGRFGRDGVSSVDVLGALCESLRANIEVRGQLLLQLAMFAVRLIRNYPRIARRLSAMRRIDR